MGPDPVGTSNATRKVAFLTCHSWPWMRQTDDGAGAHGGLTISFASSLNDDWLVAYDDISEPVRTPLPASRRILFVTEPPGFKSYKPAFANQFGVLVSPYPIPGYRGRWIASQPAINWFYGIDFSDGKPTSRIDLRGLRHLPVPDDKKRRISVVCSTKARLPGHRARLSLLESLKARFPDSIDLFGRGFKPIGDKADCIAPYRYHLVLENSSCPHFWTEKLADAYLGYALPIFVGCSNVTDYFPERSMVRVPDVADHETAIRLVSEVLDNDPWQDRLPDIIAARTELIERQNVFSVIERLTSELDGGKAITAPDIIWPAKQCGPVQSLVRAARAAGGRLTALAGRS